MCLAPYILKEPEGTPVPCGYCPQCRARRASGWSFRLLQQEKIADSSHFITLTYDTEHVPFTKAGYLTLLKTDVQLFFKRLRKKQSKTSHKKLSYYAVGEYGGHTLRPHYHIILYNANPDFVQEAWQNGSVHFGQITGASIGYTLKYMSKPGKIPLHSKDDRVPEFSLMSKGLGKNYLTPAIRRYHKSDPNNTMCLTLEDGKKISMPRYYKDRLFTPEERSLAALHWHLTLQEANTKRQQKYIAQFGLEWETRVKQLIPIEFKRKFKSAQDGRNKI